MINRRHIRIKVMQSLYALQQNGIDNIPKQEKFLFQSIENIQDLYLVILSAIIEIQKNEALLIKKKASKHLATTADKNPNKKFINNCIFKFLIQNNSLLKAIQTREVKHWTLNNDIILILIKSIKKSISYKNYIDSNQNNTKEDRLFLNTVFNEIIATNEKLYDYLEDYKMTWVDDIPTINTLISKQLCDINLKNEKSFIIPDVYKNIDDNEFTSQLFRKTIYNDKEFLEYYSDKTPNWDTTRIAIIDSIVLKMAICEMLKFNSIPIKVTINEYVEILKEYSTPNSSLFVNGILDVLSKEFENKNMLNKLDKG